MEIRSSVPRTLGDEVEVVVSRSLGQHSPGPVDFSIDAWHHSKHDQSMVTITGFRMVPEQTNYESNGYTHELQQNGHPLPNGWSNGVHHEANGVNRQLETAHAEDTNGHGNGISNSLDVVIVWNKSRDDPPLKVLVHLLEVDNGVEPSVSSFRSLEVLPRVYICLHEIDSPLLHHMTAESFHLVQKLLNCSSILWVSAGAYKNAERPESNIAQGLFRTACSELGKPASTLDLNLSSKLAPD
ncbi:hypothetical protein SUNI508_10968 [Seiridium unicorne]|uniref:Uncharacterized protein n=1 Tax=Seiridium unicorne TaxID=138068 RepID=A0ABR2UJ88_9PEZI